MRGKTVQGKCACGCGVTFSARVADRARGWGLFASKSCKARHQERKTGKNQRYHEIKRMAQDGLCFPDMSNEGLHGVGDFPYD